MQFVIYRYPIVNLRIKKNNLTFAVLLQAEEITLTIGQAFDLAYKKFLESGGKDVETRKQIGSLQKRVHFSLILITVLMYIFVNQCKTCTFSNVDILKCADEKFQQRILRGNSCY